MVNNRKENNWRANFLGDVTANRDKVERLTSKVLAMVSHVYPWLWSSAAIKALYQNFYSLSLPLVMVKGFKRRFFMSYCS